MIRSFLIIVVLMVGSFSFAHSQKKLRKEFPGGAPYLELRTSKKNHQYFVIPPAPCSCPSNEVNVICVKDIKKALKEELAKPKPSQECLPNAGCSLGWETVVGVCHAS